MKFNFQFIIFALLIGHCLSAVAAISTSVNRTQMDMSDTLQLNIQISEQTGSEEPDFTLLNQDWNILNTSRRSEISFNQGRLDALTSWVLTLSPKRIGQLMIPVLLWKQGRSRPIAVSVLAINHQLQQQIDQMAYFRTSVSTNETWVQSQVLYQVAFYYTQEVQPSKDLLPPHLTSARIQPLNKGTINLEIINGIRYRVYRRNYVLFPQASGDLIVPSESMVGYLRLNSRERRNFDVGSPEHKIKVLPKPAHYPSGETWLPAKNITISAKFTEPSEGLVIGSAINLQLKIEGQGIAGSLLPEIPEMKVEGLNIYKQPHRLEEILSPQGVSGRLTNDIAIIPVRPGKFTLPGIRFAWWDVQRGEIKEASWPGLDFEISGTSIPSEAAEKEPEAASPPPTATVAENLISTPWAYGLSLFFALGWLLTLIYLWQLKKKIRKDAYPAKKELFLATEEQDFRRLLRACQKKDPASIRQLLERWLRQASSKPEDSLQELLANDSEGQQILASLNRYLYHSKKGEFDPSPLLVWIKEKRAQMRSVVQKEHSNLAPLYPGSNG